MLAVGSVFIITVGGNNVLADNMKCSDNKGAVSWGGTAHEDNSPSSKKGKAMIESGASICEIAKACDHMEIDIAIKNADALHKTSMYKNAPEKYQKELDEYAEHGRGHDNPNLICYEVEYAVRGD